MVRFIALLIRLIKNIRISIVFDWHPKDWKFMAFRAWYDGWHYILWIGPLGIDVWG